MTNTWKWAIGIGALGAGLYALTRNKSAAPPAHAYDPSHTFAVTVGGPGVTVPLGASLTPIAPPTQWSTPGVTSSNVQVLAPAAGGGFVAIATGTSLLYGSYTATDDSLVKVSTLITVQGG